MYPTFSIKPPFLFVYILFFRGLGWPLAVTFVVSTLLFNVFHCPTIIWYLASTKMPSNDMEAFFVVSDGIAARERPLVHGPPPFA